MKTRAAILVEQRSPLELVELEVPEPTFGQVLVKVLHSGICGSQLGEIDGAKGPDPWLPHCLGHEATGVVEAIGPHVRTVSPGDHVVLHWRPGAGVQAPTPTYRWGDTTVNAGWVTTFQELTLVSENRVTRIPADCDLEGAALYGCALTTAVGVIANDAVLKPGESVVILGTGGVGLCAVLAAKLAGAFPIVAVDLYDHKLELARRYGASHVLDSSQCDDPLAALREIAGGAYDVVVENTGVLEVMRQAYALTAPRTGRTVLVGVPAKGVELPIDTMPLHFGQVLTGSFGGDVDPAYTIPRLQRLEASGAFELQGMISHRFGLEQINEAIAAMRRGEVVRCLITM